MQSQEKLIEFMNTIRALIHEQVPLTGAQHTQIANGFDQLEEFVRYASPPSESLEKHPGRKRD